MMHLRHMTTCSGRGKREEEALCNVDVMPRLFSEREIEKGGEKLVTTYFT